MKQQLCVCARVLLLTVALGSPHAFAQDGKAYPGASCQPEHPQDRSIAYYWGGRVRNLSSSVSLTLSCPVIKDQNSGIAGAWIAVEDHHPSFSVSCTLSSWLVDTRSLTARTVTVVDSQTFTTAGTPPEIPIVILGGGFSLSLGDYYELRCTVPPFSSGRMSGILYYHVYESLP